MSIQDEAKALGDPTRYRIFTYVVEHDGVGVAELTEFVGLNHNAVRQHLAVLRDALLVSEELETRQRPGRPRLLYRLHDGVAGRWGTDGPYAWLSVQLSRALRARKSARQVGYDAGRTRAKKLKGAPDAVDAVERELVRSGFQPVRRERGRRVDFVLGACPFELAAVEDPGTVCDLHRGMAEGLAEGLGSISVERLTAKNPRTAGCRLALRRDES